MTLKHPDNALRRLGCERQVLRDVGLKSEMDRDAFKGCAQRIAAAGTTQLADPGTSTSERHRLLDTAGALARYFVANVSSLHSNNFYEGVGALAWVPATEVHSSGCYPGGVCSDAARMIMLVVDEFAVMCC